MMYKFKSLGAQTNFLMDSFLAEIKETADYFVIRTPSRPSYFWGNYILMKYPPKPQSFSDWVDIYETEIGKRADQGFCAITFDLNKHDDFSIAEFKANNFRIGVDKILTANQVVKPEKFNSNLVVKEYDLGHHMDQFIEVHFCRDWQYGNESVQRQFLKEQALAFALLVKQGVAKRFAAFEGDMMIADLGVYWQGQVARFNNISTHEDHRRKAACSTLVYRVSDLLINQMGFETLVMQADEDYHAAKIYESVGFRSNEKIILLEWKDQAKFHS